MEAYLARVQLFRGMSVRGAKSQGSRRWMRWTCASRGERERMSVCILQCLPYTPTPTPTPARSSSVAS